MTALEILKQQDTERGKKALTVFYNEMRSLYPSFKFTFEEMMTVLRKLRGAKFIDEGIGGGIRETGFSDSKVNTAMRGLARNGGGKIPATYMDFFNALFLESQKINYVDMAGYVITETAGTVLGGIQDVGESLITTGKIINFLLPVILLGALFFFLDGKTSGALSRGVSKGIKGLKK